MDESARDADVSEAIADTQKQTMPAVEFELFSSSFCGDCRHTRGLLEQALRVLPTASIREHNVAEQPELAAEHQIESTPTVIVRDAAGAQVMRAEGVPTIDHLLVAADSALGSANPQDPQHQ